ncbi:MAG: hypothetical protein J4F48_07055 [Nitrospinae bacterium]|nr:hypothetical protein [Nitrospinota bacterium]
MNFDKIPNNSINIDKFTGFFDKNSAREISVKHCNSMVINTNLSAGDSNITGKFSQAPHLPVFQVNWAGLPASPRNRVRLRITGQSSTAGPPKHLPAFALIAYHRDAPEYFSGNDKYGWTRAIRELETGGLPLSEGGGLSPAGNPSLEISGVFSA